MANPPKNTDPLIGLRLGKNGFLVIRDSLGEGGMGSVYRARDTTRNCWMAVKFLHREACTDPRMVARFKREGKKFSGLTHPNLVKVYGLGKERGAYFIVSRFVEGRTLGEIVKEDGPLAVDEVLRVGREVARGLAAAHERHIVHRDLKPDNVMIRNADRAVQVIDFGIAKDLDSSTMLTAPGTYIGTVGYCAPEQLLGKDVDGRSDIFSLGVILYELLTGEMAFDGEKTVELQEATIRSRPTPVRRLNQEIVSPLARLIDRMIQKKPGRRPGDMTEVADTLDSIRKRLENGESPAERRSVKDALLQVFRR